MADDQDIALQQNPEALFPEVGKKFRGKLGNTE